MNEEKYLISLCSSYLNGEEVKLQENIDYGALFKLARHHNLLAVMHCALNGSKAQRQMPSDFTSALKNAFLDYVYAAQKQTQALDELREAMTAAGLKYVLFKGAVLRELYPVAESRAMGDVDLLINLKDIGAVNTALVGAGFECTADNGAVHDYRLGDVLFEIHNKLIDEYDSAFSDAFVYAEFDGCRGIPEPDFHFAYLIAHTAHHFKYYGAGLKLVLDLAVMLKNYDINLDRVFDRLDAVGLRKFAEILLTVCNKWFGVGKTYAHDTESTERFLIIGGAFGSLADNKSAVLTRRELEEGRSGNPLSTAFHLAFPSYEKLRKLKYISFIDGRPWLTPAAWCYRWAYTVKNRGAFTKKAVASIGEKETMEQAEKQLAFFEEIGIQ